MEKVLKNKHANIRQIRDNLEKLGTLHFMRLLTLHFLNLLEKAPRK